VDILPRSSPWYGDTGPVRQNALAFWTVALIDRLGKIAYKSGRGPFGFKPAELEHSLVLLLQHEETGATADRTGKPVREAISRRANDGSR
jgi:hypothetical protein